MCQHRASPLRILVVGSFGSGKSCLVNSLVGQVVARDYSSISGGTTAISQYDGEVKTKTESYCLTVVDTPGLQSSLENDQLLKEITPKHYDSNVVLVCFNVTRERVTKDDITVIKQLTDSFGTEMWKKAVFVLTFSNQLSLYEPNLKLDSWHHLYNYRKAMWTGFLHDSLKYVGVGHQEALNVPANLAGLGQEAIPYLHSNSHWLDDLWITCSNRAISIEGGNGMN